MRKCLQSTTESTKTSSSTWIELALNKLLKMLFNWLQHQHLLNQHWHWYLSNQLTLTSLYVWFHQFWLHPTSTSAIAIIPSSSVSPSLIKQSPKMTTKPRDISPQKNTEFSFQIFTTQHRKMDVYVKSVLHWLLKKVIDDL